MKRFIEGEERCQVTLLPECLDDYMAEDNPIRVLDVFVEGLHLHKVGFEGAEPAATSAVPGTLTNNGVRGCRLQKSPVLIQYMPSTPR